MDNQNQTTEPQKVTPPVETAAKAAPVENTGMNGAFPAELNGWNWGAFFLTWIWGVFHSVWVSLLCFIPGLNIIMMILLGLKGNEWAWQHRKFESVEQFKAVQKAWMKWGIGIFIASIVLGIIMAVGIVSLGTLAVFSSAKSSTSTTDTPTYSFDTDYSYGADSSTTNGEVTNE